MASKKPGLKNVEIDGIKVALDKDALDDIELIDWMDEVADGNALKVPKILKRILGDQYKRVYDELRNERGVVTATKAADFFTKMMGEMEDGKN